MNITSSRFFGGPERQMLGLAKAGRIRFQSSFASFSENNLCCDFLTRASDCGFQAIELKHDTPNLFGAFRDLSEVLGDWNIDLLVCHGYKAAIVGWFAARWMSIPVVAVSRGWTGECRRVRVYDAIDRKMLRWMNHVVCVSQAQADKVLSAGVDFEKIDVIRNSIDADRFTKVNVEDRQCLLDQFPMQVNSSIKRIIGAVGRLSPEKGFDIFVNAAEKAIRMRGDLGFLIFGDGRLRFELKKQIAEAGIADRVVLVGFCSEIDRFFPHLDLFIQSSHTEGLPNVVLESLAVGVPVIATDVGGTGEVLLDNQNGRLVQPGDSNLLAAAILEALSNPERLLRLSHAGREWIRDNFTFEEQAKLYSELFKSLIRGTH